ncbi:MAG: caspase family protein, partial [Alphaproteobacteria bacterium]
MSGVERNAMIALWKKMVGRLALMVSLALTLCSPLMAAVTENTYGVAVIIGNQDYRGDLPKVEFSRNDAAAMKKFVVERLGFRDGNIIDLRDATQAEMEAAFGNERTHEGKLWRWLRPEKSDVVVFYSGHGVPGRDGERGFLLPVDA